MKRSEIVLLSILLLLSLSAGVAAQQITDPIPEHDSFTIESRAVKELRTINVWIPKEYAENADALPVLYMLDGGIKEDFPHIANTLSELIAADKIEPILLVGIENTQRRRDLTGPTEVKKDKKIAPVVGESASFRAFVRDELFAEVNKRYRTNTSKGIIGESLAGLFVTETFLLEPDMFDFYIAFDPSLWWNNMYLVKNATQYLANNSGKAKTFWFASSDAKDIVKSTSQLAAVLKERNNDQLIWTYSPEPAEQHSTIFRATKEKAITWTLNNMPETQH
jgi:predicted alpha/beta superfamily hydrolase